MILFLCNFLIQNILALEEDEFYCKSKSETYKNACKKCINEENCNYGKFKSCQCIDLELFNSDTEGEWYKTICFFLYFLHILANIYAIF